MYFVIMYAHNSVLKWFALQWCHLSC